METGDLTAALRSILFVGSGYFVRKGLLSQSDSEVLIPAVVIVITGIWTAWVRYKRRFERQAASELPSSATLPEIKQRAAELNPAPLVPQILK